MKFKAMLFICLLVCFFTMASVVAVDVNDTVLNYSDENQVIEGINDNSNENEIIGEVDDGTFTALQNKINGATGGSTITLENDYSYNDGFYDLYSRKYVSIGKSITIDGNNHKIDSLTTSAIFYLDVGNVTLKNINFKNVKDTSGAIRFKNKIGNVEIYNCTFINCYGPQGGAIYSSGTFNDTISYCRFINCSSFQEGGALSLDGENCTISNCHFAGCKAIGSGWEGGAIYSSVVNLTVDECIFENCFADYVGGAMYLIRNTTIYNCRFVNCSSGYDAGAVYWWGKHENLSRIINITGCSFQDCFAKNNGGAIYLESSDESQNLIVNCSFKNSAAKRGNAIYSKSNTIIVYNSTFVNSNVENEVYRITLINCTVETLTESEDSTTPSNEAITQQDDGTVIINLPNDAKGTITVFVNGVRYRVVEVVNGIVRIDLSAYKNGNYLITFEYSGDSKYAPFKRSLTLNQKSAPKKTLTLKTVKVKKSAKKLVLQATLKQGKKALAGIKITFKFNGKKYTAKTNKKGIAKVTIKKSVLKKLKVGKKVKYQASYGKIIVKKTAKIKK